MSDFERDLHDRLNARADAVPVAEEWDDLLDRVVRKSKRTTRGLALLTVFAVCVGALGVVVAARSDGTKAKDKAAPARDTIVPTNAQLPTMPALGSQETFASVAGSGSSAAPNGFLNTGPTTQLKVASAGASPIWIGAIGGNGMKMAKVFTRTTASGEVIRAYRTKVAPVSVTGPPWWKPADYCFPNGYAQADVSDANIAGIGMGPLYAAFRDGAKVGGTVNVVGVSEQLPRWIVVAQGPANAAKLRATFPGGSHDEMAPVDGLAILVGSGQVNDEKAKVKLEAVDAGGASLGSADVGPYGMTISTELTTPDNACMAPDKLPAPGKQQPADAAAAKQAVESTFAAAFTHGISEADFAKYFDDAHGFADVMTKLRAGTFKDQVRDAQMKLDDVVFLAPDTAAIKYHIEIPNYANFDNRFTEAHLVNGEWKLARQGWCNDVSMAGVECPS